MSFSLKFNGEESIKKSHTLGKKYCHWMPGEIIVANGRPSFSDTNSSYVCDKQNPEE